MSFFILVGIFIILYSLLAMTFFSFITQMTTDNRFRASTKVLLLLFPFYLFAVWWVGSENYNRVGTSMHWTKDEQLKCNDFHINGQVLVLDKNPWLLEKNNIYISNKKVFDHPECLGIFLKTMSSSQGKISYRIYEEIKEIKTVQDDGRIKIKHIGKNLIMEINNETNCELK